MLLPKNYPSHVTAKELHACSVHLIVVSFDSDKNSLDPHSHPHLDHISSPGLDLGTCHLLLVISMAEKQSSGHEEFQPPEA